MPNTAAERIAASIRDDRAGASDPIIERVQVHAYACRPRAASQGAWQTCRLPAPWPALPLADGGDLRLLVEQVLRGVLMRLECRRDLRDQRSRFRVLQGRQQRRRHGVDDGLVERYLLLEKDAVERLAVGGLQGPHGG